jgi:hypothetical protein
VTAATPGHAAYEACECGLPVVIQTADAALILVAFKQDIAPRQGEDVRRAWLEKAAGAKVIVLGSVDEVRAWTPEEAREPQPTPSAAPSPVLLDAYKGDNRRLRGRLDDLLGRFAPDGIGYRASLSAAELAQEYRDVPLPVPDQLRHLEER